MNAFFSSIFQIWRDPRLLTFLQTAIGKSTILFLFALILMMTNLFWWPQHEVGHFHWWPIVMLALTLMTTMPKYRRLWLSIFSFISLFFLPWFILPQGAVNLAQMTHVFIWLIVMVFMMIYIMVISTYRKKKICQYPILNLILLVFIVMAVTSTLSGTMKTNLWTGLSLLTAYFWYFSYTLNSINQYPLKNSLLQITRYLPFWGGTATPYPKGQQFLDAIEAKSSEALAKSQLAGLQLLLLAVIWYAVLLVMEITYHRFNLPSWISVLHGQATHHASIGISWLVLIHHFFFQMLYYAINGHLIISIVRMAGFLAPKNMDKPLVAVSIADFWNRYYFYFKELLVDLFFYPTYFRCSKIPTQWRMVIATTMAAGVGNVIYHYFTTLEYPIHYGLLKSLSMMRVYYFYAAVLSIGIVISQWLTLRRRVIAMSRLHRYVLRPVIIIGFFALLSIFNEPYESLSLVTSLKFLGSLFGI